MLSITLRNNVFGRKLQFIAFFEFWAINFRLLAEDFRQDCHWCKLRRVFFWENRLRTRIKVAKVFVLFFQTLRNFSLFFGEWFRHGCDNCNLRNQRIFSIKNVFRKKIKYQISLTIEQILFAILAKIDESVKKSILRVQRNFLRFFSGEPQKNFDYFSPLSIKPSECSLITVPSFFFTKELSTINESHFRIVFSVKMAFFKYPWT